MPRFGLVFYCLSILTLVSPQFVSSGSPLLSEKSRSLFEQLALEEEFSKDIASLITEATLDSNCDGNVFIASKGCIDFVSYMLIELSDWAPPVLLVTFEEFKKINHAEVWATFLAWKKRPCSLVFVCDLMRAVVEEIPVNITESEEGISTESISRSIVYLDDEEEIGYLQFSKFLESTDQVLYLLDGTLNNLVENSSKIQRYSDNQEKIIKQSGIMLQVTAENFAEPEALIHVQSICEYCGPNSRQHQRELGSWQRNKTQFAKFFHVFKDFHKISFNKTNLNIGYFNHPPHFACYFVNQVKDESINNSEIFVNESNFMIQENIDDMASCEGVEWEMISQMEESLDFTSTWINLSNPDDQGFLGELSNISNMIASFEAEKIDLAVGGISVTPKRILYVDFSSVFANDPIVFVVEKRRDLFALGIWLAFNPEVWPFIFLLIGIISFLFHIIIYQYTLERPKKSTTGKWAMSAYLRRQYEDGKRKPICVTMFEALEITLQPLLGQPLDATQITHRPRRLLKLLLAIWWFSCLIISTLYNTSLITSLINPISPKEPESLQELLDFGYHFKPAGKQGAFFELVRSVLDQLPENDEFDEFEDEEKFPSKEERSVSLIKQINDRLITDGARSHSMVAYVVEESAVKGIQWDKKEIGFSQIKVIRERLFLTTYAWPTQRHAPFKEKIDVALGRLNSAGLVEYWYDEFGTRDKDRKGREFRLREKLGQINLNMQVLQGAFIFLIFGYCMGALVLGLEHLTKRYTFRFFTKVEIVTFSKSVIRRMRKVYTKHFAAEDEDLKLRRRKNKMRFRGVVRTVTAFKQKDEVLPFMK